MGQLLSSSAGSDDPPAPLLQPSMEGDIDEVKRLVGRFIASCDSNGSASALATSPPSTDNATATATATVVDPQLRTYVNRADPAGNAAVHGAAFGGHLLVLKFLVEACGASLEQKNGLGCSALWLAAGYNKTDVLAYIIQRWQGGDGVGLAAALSEANNTGDTPILAAASRGNKEACKTLLDAAAGETEAGEGKNGVCLDMLRRANDGGDTPLKVAVGAGYAEVVDLLLDWEDEAVAGDADGERTLNLRNQQGLTPLLVACERNHASIARTLIDRGADWTACDENGKSILAVASFCGCQDVVDMLLGLPVGKELLNKSDDAAQCTPLWFAARTGNAKMVRALLDVGADRTLANADGLTPEQAAEKYKKEAVVDLFHEYVDDVIDRDLDKDDIDGT